MIKTLRSGGEKSIWLGLAEFSACGRLPDATTEANARETNLAFSSRPSPVPPPAHTQLSARLTRMSLLSTSLSEEIGSSRPDVAQGAVPSVRPSHSAKANDKAKIIAASTGAVVTSLTSKHSSLLSAQPQVVCATGLARVVPIVGCRVRVEPKQRASDHHISSTLGEARSVIALYLVNDANSLFSRSDAL